MRQAEARASGSISALSRWGEVRETLAKDPRFLHNRDAGQGSCACELFDDVRVEMEQEHEERRESGVVAPKEKRDAALRPSRKAVAPKAPRRGPRGPRYYIQ